MNSNKKHLISSGALALVFVLFVFNQCRENKTLKKQIKNRSKEIEKIDSEKKIIYLELNELKIAVEKKDSIILELSKKETEILNNISANKEHFENEKNSYNNSDNNERVILFSKLASERN